MPDPAELPRFPPLTPANKNLNEAQGAQYAYLAEMTKKVYGNKIITQNLDGALQGPLNILL
jgi:hypothetical protein